jgi:hypothetical protein
VVKAILIPANPKLSYSTTESSEPGSILAHSAHIEENEGVLWRLVVPGEQDMSRSSKMKFSDEISTGYLYDVPTKKVTHKIDIEWIKNEKEMTIKDKNRFDQPMRDHAVDKEIPFFYILIRNIFLLKKPQPLSDFIKVNGTPVENLRNYAIVNDPSLAHFDRSITRADIMSAYLADILIRSKEIKEKDVEHLFLLQLLKQQQQLVKRQYSFKKGGRADLVFKDKSGAFWVYELKRDVATVKTIEQVNGYARQISKQERIPLEKINRVIIARDADLQLRLNAKREGVRIWKYGFEVKISPIE